MLKVMDEELVDIVDEAGKALRQVHKTEAHKHGWLHKTVIGYVRYGDDWALISQAADRQDAGQLVAPVGGHVKAGETELEALLREAEEEIGVKSISHKHVGTARFHRQIIGRDENHLFVVYEISTDEGIVLGPEAVDIKRFTTQELKRALHKRPDDFGDALFFVFEHFYPEFLPSGWIYRHKRTRAIL
jgi:8-oxo-dGTP pyrophosphatase MutT (NUDIX family)